MLKNIAMGIGAISVCIISSAGTVWYIMTDIKKQKQKDEMILLNSILDNNNKKIASALAEKIQELENQTQKEKEKKIELK
jgi:hypothetical protein